MKTSNFKTVFAGLFTCFTLYAAAQSGYGEIRGLVKDKNDLEPVPYATVKILQGARLVGGTQTDENGKYSYKPLDAGSYEMVITDPGHATQPVNKIKVIPNEPTYVDVKLQPNTLEGVVVVAKPIEHLPTGVDIHMAIVKSIDATELHQTAGYNPGDVTGVLPILTSEVIESGGEMHFRGARGSATGYFVDGVRTLASTGVPGPAIENLTVLSGGVPAMYGDITSGVVIITTKSYFSGIREKNIRVAEYRERKAEEKARQKALEDEKNRLKEIEAEKAKEKQS